MKVILFCTTSVDGKIATGSADSTEWTTKGNKRIFAEETKKAGVIIMGNNTFKAIGRPLPDRLNVVVTASTAGKESQRGVLEYMAAQPRRIWEQLKKRGFKTVFVIGGGRANSLFMKAGVINEIWLLWEPVVLGEGLGLFAEVGKTKLKLISVQRVLDNLLFVKYGVETA